MVETRRGSFAKLHLRVDVNSHEVGSGLARESSPSNEFNSQTAKLQYGRTIDDSLDFATANVPGNFRLERRFVEEYFSVAPEGLTPEDLSPEDHQHRQDLVDSSHPPRLVDTVFILSN